ncbi:hypothetical protein BT63DRAFT_459413 [Microthyrium microscopicum]|uniref:Protein BNI4 n=1 Tax=Microthyrium microscopicum TaxID=703497 RepID=A0A6A6U0L3_9PEZI|nr:hypothetical protein BT63DRAFT_459413 [Microthyrium microscopicum]
MAEVLSPIVSSTSTMTILRSPQDAFQSPSPNQAHMTAPRPGQQTRNSMYNPQLAQMAYRATPPVGSSPYTFNNTPVSRQDRRKSAGPVLKHQGNLSQRPLYTDSSSSSNVSSASSSSQRSNHYTLSKDDSMIAYQQKQNMVQNRLSVASLSTPDLSLASQVKPSPDRYRRQSRLVENTPLAQDSRQHFNDTQRPVQPITAPIPPFSVKPQQELNPAPILVAPTARQSNGEETNSPAARYKRRSTANMDSSPVLRPVSSPVNAVPVTSAPSWSQVASGKHNIQGPLPPPAPYSRPVHMRSNSSGDNRPQVARPTQSSEIRPGTAPSMPVARPRSNLATPVNSSALPERPSTAIAAPRAAEQQRPSTSGGRMVQNNQDNSSPAFQKLSAINDKPGNKGVKSRLRRAFSFSSSHELRKATAENHLAAEQARLRKEKFESGNGNGDDAVAAQQEASGLGNNIYSHQGKFATSTDNISMSSTASSASIMLRNIGRGMKKSTRNLRSLFRPKSVIGVPAADNATAEAASGVSLVTIEAERENVNINVDPHDVPGGGTNYPKLERNSVDLATELPSSSQINRKSIVGGDRERSEVLAAVRKGILKRKETKLLPNRILLTTFQGSVNSSTSSSPSVAQEEIPTPTFAGDNSLPPSPIVRASTEVEKDFFQANQNASASTRSLPAPIMRNISFNSRVQFFDVFSASEYDRRGDIATCNRLTPMLAQQIKEELNSFKMEMEVHEESKPHTHFF